MELVGTAMTMDPLSLKRLLLIFDRIGVSRLAFLPEHVADVQPLIERGILFAVGASQMPADAPDAWSAALGEAGRANAAAHLAALQERMGQEQPDLSALRRAHRNAEARAMAITLSERDHLDAIPITEGWTPLPNQVVTKTDVVHLTLYDMPVPGDRHSLMDVVAFRDEAQTQRLRTGLRDWMRGIVRADFTGADASARLEHLIAEYRRALELERMKRDTTWLETFIFPAKGLTEYLTTLGSKLFTVRRAEADLKAAEMRLPGHEVAYIVKGREHFGA